MPCAASQLSWCQAKVRPQTGSRVFGQVSVSGRMRVPSPPARITHCILVSGHQLRAFVIESEADFAQTFLGHGFAERVAIVGVEEQESAAARADQLTADGAVLAADFIPAIDAIVGSAGRALLFAQPVLVQQLAEAARVAFFER